MSEAVEAHFKTEVHGNILVFRLQDKQIRGDTLAEALRAQLRAAVEQSKSRLVVIDLSAVTYVSSAAFRPLLSLKRLLEGLGGRLLLTGLQPLVAEEFQLLRLVSTSKSYPAPFELADSLEDGVAALKKLGN